MSLSSQAIAITRQLTPVETAQRDQEQIVTAGFFDLKGFELMQRIAKGFASSTLVPKDYRDNVANCMVAINLANRINADPLMAMQNLNLIQGRPTWSAKFLIATVNTCGQFSKLSFEWFGVEGEDGWGCRAFCSSKDTGKVLMGAKVTIRLAKEEKWYHKDGSKWKTMPEQMLMYRAASFWVNVHAPELSLGLMTTEEARDIEDSIRTTVPRVIRAAEGPRTIQSTLDNFATDDEPQSLDNGAEPTEDSTAMQGHGFVSPDMAQQESPAAVMASVTVEKPVRGTAPADAVPTAEAGAVSADPLARARENGRKAATAGLPRILPGGFHYKSRRAEKDAWCEGYDRASTDFSDELHQADAGFGV